MQTERLVSHQTVFYFCRIRNLQISLLSFSDFRSPSIDSAQSVFVTSSSDCRRDECFYSINTLCFINPVAISSQVHTGRNKLSLGRLSSLDVHNHTFTPEPTDEMLADANVC